jgi:hypothetical protein
VLDVRDGKNGEYMIATKTERAVKGKTLAKGLWLAATIAAWLLVAAAPAQSRYVYGESHGRQP